jgi:glycerate 2-kinase
MARALEDHWDGPLEGLVITRYGYEVPCQRIRDRAGRAPGARCGRAAAPRSASCNSCSGLTADDLVIALISGGGSSLLVAPGAGPHAGRQAGRERRAAEAAAPAISEMNCVRRHLSAIKGGRLAAACYPAVVLTLLISDVPGDDAAIDIASGPTVADPTTCANARAIIDRYRIELPPAVRALLQRAEGEIVKPGDARLARAEPA